MAGQAKRTTAPGRPGRRRGRGRGRGRGRRRVYARRGKRFFGAERVFRGIRRVVRGGVRVVPRVLLLRRRVSRRGGLLRGLRAARDVRRSESLLSGSRGERRIERSAADELDGPRPSPGLVRVGRCCSRRTRRSEAAGGTGNLVHVAASLTASLTRGPGGARRRTPSVRCFASAHARTTVRLRRRGGVVGTGRSRRRRRRRFRRKRRRFRRRLRRSERYVAQRRAPPSASVPFAPARAVPAAPRLAAVPARRVYEAAGGAAVLSVLRHARAAAAAAARGPARCAGRRRRGEAVGADRRSGADPDRGLRVYLGRGRRRKGMGGAQGRERPRVGGGAGKYVRRRRGDERDRQSRKKQSRSLLRAERGGGAEEVRAARSLGRLGG